MRNDPGLSPSLAVQALSSAAETILETMFFTAADTAEPPGEWQGPTITAQLDYAGRFSGRFILELDQSCATALAGNALGEPIENEFCALQQEHLACELANILCGNTLNRLEPAQQFDLTQPRIVEASAERPCPAGKTCCAVRWLQAEAGLLRLCIEWKG